MIIKILITLSVIICVFTLFVVMNQSLWELVGYEMVKILNATWLFLAVIVLLIKIVWQKNKNKNDL